MADGDPKDFSIVLAEYPGETFIVGQAIPPTSRILKHWMDIVSASLNVTTLSDDMNRAAKLLDVGHLASADFPLIQNQIWGILKDYQTAVNETDLAMNAFVIESGHVLSNLQASLDYIMRRNFRRAVTMAKRCAASAKTLAATADQVAKRFQSMADSAGKAVGDAQTATNTRQSQVKDMDAQINKMKADYATLQSLSASYDAQKKRVQALYEATLAQAETAETRAFVSSLVGGVCTAVGQGLSAYAAARTPSLNIGGLGNFAPTQGTAAIPPAPAKTAPAKTTAKPPAGKTPAKTPAKDTPKDPAEAKPRPGVISAGTAGDLKKAINAKDNPGNKIGAGDDDGMDDALDDDTKAPAAAGKKPAAKDDKTTPTAKKPVAAAAANPAKDDKTASPTVPAKKEDAALTPEELNARVKGIAAAANKVGDVAGDMADKAEASAVALRKEVSDLLNLQFQIEDKRADALAKMASYTVQLQDEVDTVSTIEIAVASLAQSIGAMQSVCAIFQQMSAYWKGMELACNNLDASSSFEQNMTDVESDIAHADDVIDDHFKESAIEYCAGWTALNMISSDYRAKMTTLSQDVKGFVASAPAPEAARQAAKTLAASLGLDVSRAEEATKDRARRIAAVNKVLMTDTTKLIGDEGKAQPIT